MTDRINVALILDDKKRENKRLSDILNEDLFENIFFELHIFDEKRLNLSAFHVVLIPSFLYLTSKVMQESVEKYKASVKLILFGDPFLIKHIAPLNVQDYIKEPLIKEEIYFRIMRLFPVKPTDSFYLGELKVSITSLSWQEYTIPLQLNEYKIIYRLYLSIGYICKKSVLIEALKTEKYKNTKILNTYVSSLREYFKELEKKGLKTPPLIITIGSEGFRLTLSP